MNTRFIAIADLSAETRQRIVEAILCNDIGRVDNVRMVVSPALPEPVCIQPRRKEAQWKSERRGRR